MPIQVLHSEVVSKIAAGEVIERPASVVKELVENCLDAGASQVGVEVRNGGTELIKVSDNGVGIPATEVELAFRRYATSKISNLGDLESISSLGFRGEALPSIAAVAEVEIVTKTYSEAAGTFVHVKDGDVVRSEVRARPNGTTVTVRRLFHGFPARLKFLKSAATENSHIANMLSQYSLAFPEVRFSLLIDGRLSLSTPGDGDLRSVVNQLYGSQVAGAMLEVQGNHAFVESGGLTSPPSVNRANRNYLSFFANRRWVRSPLLIRAAEEGYHGLLMDGRHPIAVINVSLPPQEIDVNVHPAKAQVRFRHEQDVFLEVKNTIKEALAKAPVASKRMPASATSWQQQSLQMVKEREPSFIAPLPALGLPILRPIGQLANTYIVAEGDEGLYLIDQHAAHERILYEKVLAQWAQREIEVQGLLEPETMELSPREEETLKNTQVSLAQFGFALESFGQRSHLIRAVPALIVGTNLVEAIRLLLDSLASKDIPAPWEEKVAKSLACHGAIKAGQQLSNEEMRQLIRQLEQCDQPRSCPHGRPTLIHLSSRQLEREFGRTG
jgi:DNA mismatch repair protein MutL